MTDKDTKSMRTFLNTVAKDLLRKYGNDLHRLTVVFPNKRASLFLNAALAEESGKPVWSPQYTTISDLFRSQSQMEIADRIQLVCELYKSYVEVTQSTEPLDQFYSWGEMMLTDFDDIDKHMTDAKRIFVLLGNIHELDSVDYLTEEQQHVIQRFFSNFSAEHNSELKRRFLQLWNRFGEIYANYRQRLTEQGIAYEGMLYRAVIEGMQDTAQLPQSSFIFVGFNLLNTVEEKLFSMLQRERNARFYWDFDEYYMKPGAEAGHYISQYMKIFPNEIEAGSDTYRQFANKRETAFIASPTEDLQARYVSQWLTPERIAAGRRTAIVLADERLLETVLHCLPDEVKHVNITTGFPLDQSPAASLVRLVAALLQRRSYTLHIVNGILRHPYAKYISPQATELYNTLNKNKLYHPTLAELSSDESLKRLFTPLVDRNDCKEINARLLWLVRHVAKNAEDDAFTSESLFRMYTLLNRLETLALGEWSFALYGKLLQQIIQLTTVPFHGEPLEGIQIMGVLETRNLDFDHVLVLSCNEGNLPARLTDSSFIPHSIRKAYELTTIDNKVAIYSYYFHRLLQRAGDIHLLYNNSANETKTGEMSRFMLQLLAESPLKIGQFTLQAGQSMTQSRLESVEKTEDMVDMFIEKGRFSPSALSKYLRCQMAFYHRYVAGIKDDEEGDEEKIDNRTFGTIFHAAAEEIYRPFAAEDGGQELAAGRAVTREYLTSLLEEKGHVTVRRIVDKAFRDKLFNLKDSDRPTPRLGGLLVINREMIITFLLNLLRFDMQSTPFRIVGVEKEMYTTLHIRTIRGLRCIKVGGFIDRLDLVDGTLRIIDYKTGRYTQLNLPAIEDVFLPASIGKHSDYYLQAMMYSYIVATELADSQTTNGVSSATPVSPLLIYIQQVGKPGYSPELNIGKEPITDARKYFETYVRQLTTLIEEVLNPAIPFSPTADQKRCEYCSYRKLCGRQL